MVWCGLFPEICVCWLVISQESFLLSFLAFLFFVFSFLWNALKRTTGREKKRKEKESSCVGVQSGCSGWRMSRDTPFSLFAASGFLSVSQKAFVECAWEKTG